MSVRSQVVFLGPSLSHDEARVLLPDAVLLPPAAMGDVLAAVRVYRPHAIGLIDGSFLGTMSVFHKELLYAIDQGSWVLGAASMGALRAADCAAYGVIGVGEIYEAFSSGAMEDDDEVALAHAGAEHGFRATSDALVTIRATLAAACAAGLIDASMAVELVARQKSRWFPERSLARVPADAADLGAEAAVIEELSAFVRLKVVDPKRHDAIALLTALRELPDGPPEFRPGTVISPTFAATLARDAPIPVEVGDAQASITPDRIRRWAMLHEPQAAHVLRAARERRALVRLATLLMGPPEPADLAQAQQRLEQRMGVPRAEWSDPQVGLDLDESAARDLVFADAAIERVLRSFIGRPSQALSTTPFLNHVRRSGDYPRIRDAAGRQAHQASLVELDPRMTAQDVVRAFAHLTGWVPPEDLDAYIDEQELGNPQELLLLMSMTVRAAIADGVDVMALLADASGLSASPIDSAPPEPRPSRGQ